VNGHVFVCYRYRCDCNNPGKWTVMYLCVRGIAVIVTTQESGRSCILCARGIAVIVTTQESERLCILCVRAIAVIVTTQESERSCICVLEVSL
jgi:hypothetical protein